MDGFEKISTELELLIYKHFNMRFGYYRRSVNFLEPYIKLNRLANRGRRMVIALIAMYAALFVTGAVVLGVYFFQTQGLKKETDFISGKINAEREDQLKADLKEAEALRNYNRGIRDIYESDNAIHGDESSLTVDVLGKLTNTTGINVNLVAVYYSNSERLVTLECETDDLSVPVQHIKNLRNKFPNADFEYTGYVVVNGMVKFTVYCRLPEQSEE